MPLIPKFILHTSPCAYFYALRSVHHPSLLMRKAFTVLLAGILATGLVQAQLPEHVTLIRKSMPNTAALEQQVTAEAARFSAKLAQAQAKARAMGIPLEIGGKNGQPKLVIMDIDELGNPVYAGSDYLLTANTYGINNIWVGGSSGYNLSGRNYLTGVWDGGSSLLNHIEYDGRATLGDGAGLDDHATHVTGTIMSRGVNPQAKGMAYESSVRNYSSTNALAEMPGEARNGAVAANHSWSFRRGFQFGGGWVFNGPAQPINQPDPGYGYYSTVARDWDAAALTMPYFLMCKSAGNDRGSGPAPGESYTAQGQTFVQGAVGSATYRPINGPYDCMSNHSISKNLLSVAAVSAIANGYRNPADVRMSSFSSWGPSDDGRIKPDIAGVGVNVLSTYLPNTNSYANLDGTSMSTPSLTGSVVLLQEMYSNTHGGRLLRAESLKGLIIHTANEAGPNPGPDYMFGWGLANIKGASDVIGKDSINHILAERVHTSGTVTTIPVTVAQAGPLKATISWFDQPGAVNPAMPLNERVPKLVNDLDIRIRRVSDNTLFLPWILDPNNPAAAATTADNFRDNVEQVFVANAQPGQYEIIISNKGNLVGGPQSYGLFVSGISGPLADRYCAPLITYGASTGSLTDGSGSAQYRPNTDCSWYMDMRDTTSALDIQFQEMDLAAGDTLYLYAGTQANNTLLAKYSGNTLPSRQMIPKARLYVRFTSDANTEAAGFRFSWGRMTTPRVTAAMGSAVICAGNAVNLVGSTILANDTAGLSWAWTLTGPVTLTATGQNVSLNVPVPGVYTASVIATNAVGSTPVSVSQTLTVRNGTPYANAYTEERFDLNTAWPLNAADSLGNWTYESSTTTPNRWARTKLAAFSDSAAAMIRTNAVTPGTVRSLISPAFNLSSLPINSRLRFRIALAKRVAADNDELKLFYSTNCGASWTAMAYTRNGSTNPMLYTTTRTSTFPFIPTRAEWRQEAVLIPNVARNAQRVHFKWELTNTNSTNLYMDDVMVGDSTLVGLNAGLTQVSDLAMLYPNPSNGAEANLKLNVQAGAPVRIRITDVLGRTEVAEIGAAPEDGVLPLGRVVSKARQQGIYLVQVEAQGMVQTLRWVVQD